MVWYPQSMKEGYPRSTDPNLTAGLATLAIAVSLFSFSASAQTYPISGVWVAMDHSRFPEMKVGACLVACTRFC